MKFRVEDEVCGAVGKDLASAHAHTRTHKAAPVVPLAAIHQHVVVGSGVVQHGEDLPEPIGHAVDCLSDHGHSLTSSSYSGRLRNSDVSDGDTIGP